MPQEREPHDVEVSIEELLPIADLEDAGREAARLNHTNSADPAVQATLDDVARASAKAFHRPAFAPEMFADDALRVEDHERDTARETEAEHARALAVTEVHRRREEEASFEASVEKPQVSWLCTMTATVVVGLSTAPALHDRFFVSVADAFLAWFLALALGSTVGALVTAFIIGPYSSGKHAAVSGAAKLGGVLVGVGAFLMRISDALTPSEWLGSAGLTALEISVVLMLDFYSSSLRRSYIAWAEQESKRRALHDRVAEAERALASREHALDSAREKGLAFRRFLDERACRATPVETLEAICVAAVRRGYTEGISAIQGLRLGVWRRSA
jgi:hypothetical protein